MKKFKDFDYEIKGLDEQKGIVEFYANSFNNKDSDGDIIEKGAFEKSIKENFKRIRHLLNHEKSIGVPIEMKEDSFGLLVKSQLIMGKQIGRETFEEYKAYASVGNSMEHSIGFFTEKEYKDDARKANIIKEVRLMDVTTMETWGANEFTPQVALKKFRSIDDAIETLEMMLKGKFSDERLKDIEEQLKILKSLINEPGDTTQKTGEPIDEVNYLYNNLKLLTWTKNN